MRTNQAPVILLTCLGLITVGLLTILFHDNEEQDGFSPGTAQQKQSLSSTTYPLPGLETSQKKIPDHGKDNLYAPPGYVPEILESSLFSSLELQQGTPQEYISKPANEPSINDGSMSMGRPYPRRSWQSGLPTAGLSTSRPVGSKKPFNTPWDSGKSYYNPPRPPQDNSTVKRFQNTPADTMWYRFPEEPRSPAYPDSSDSTYGYPKDSYDPPDNMRLYRPKRRNLWRGADNY